MHESVREYKFEKASHQTLKGLAFSFNCSYIVVLTENLNIV